MKKREKVAAQLLLHNCEEDLTYLNANMYLVLLQKSGIESYPAIVDS